jgi:hypothetical protein
MTAFYRRMTGVASNLLQRFRQGDVVYVDQCSTGGYAPSVAQAGKYPLDAVVSGATKGPLVEVGDLQVVCAVFDVAPDIAGAVIVDGVDYQVLQVEQIPAAGEPVAWRLLVRR